MFNIRLTNDFAFKRIFGQEDTKDILAAFLTDVLGFVVSDDIELENTEISPEYVRDKASRLDITARIGGKEKINVEIQLINEHNIDKRTLYYWGKYYVRDLGEGEDYGKLIKTISIILTGYDVFKGKPENYHSVFYAMEKTRRERFFDDFEIHVIELPKFLRQEKKAELSGLDAWMLFLERAGDKETMERIAEKKPILRRAITIAEMMEQDKHQRWLYEMREKGLKDIRSIESHAREEGMQQGIEKGIEQGIEKGMEQGERQGKLETARKMISRGMEIAVIADLTGLPEDDIKALR